MLVRFGRLRCSRRGSGSLRSRCRRRLFDARSVGLVIYVRATQYSYAGALTADVASSEVASHNKVHLWHYHRFISICRPIAEYSSQEILHGFPRRNKSRIDLRCLMTRVKYLKASFQLDVVEVVGRTNGARLSKHAITAFKRCKDIMSRTDAGKREWGGTAAGVGVGQYHFGGVLGFLLPRGAKC